MAEILFPMQIFPFWFYTKSLNLCLAIVNCQCFMSQKILASKHVLHILRTKVQNFLDFKLVLLVFLAEYACFNQNKTKVATKIYSFS